MPILNTRVLFANGIKFKNASGSILENVMSPLSRHVVRSVAVVAVGGGWWGGRGHVSELS